MILKLSLLNLTKKVILQAKQKKSKKICKRWHWRKINKEGDPTILKQIQFRKQKYFSYILVKSILHLLQLEIVQVIGN